jgi:hypothetical protein
VVETTMELETAFDVTFPEDEDQPRPLARPFAWSNNAWPRKSDKTCAGASR